MASHYSDYEEYEVINKKLSYDNDAKEEMKASETRFMAEVITLKGDIEHIKSYAYN